MIADMKEYFGYASIIIAAIGYIPYITTRFFVANLV